MMRPSKLASASSRKRRSSRDGRLFDLQRISEAARRAGAAFVIDGTQSVGALPLSVEKLKPDFLTCSAYKCLLCPYGFGFLLCPYGFRFLYVAPHRQEGRPLEEHYFAVQIVEAVDRAADPSDRELWLRGLAMALQAGSIFIPTTRSCRR
jgi:hypothetical protein